MKLKHRTENVKKRLGILLLITLLLSTMFLFTANADQAIKVKVNGAYVNFEHLPVNKDGSVLVPVSDIFKALNLSVGWNAETQTVYGYIDNTMIKLVIGSKTAIIQTDENTSKEVQLDVPAQLISSKTYVPARFIAEAIGAKIYWNSLENTILINTNVEIGKSQGVFGYFEGETVNGIPCGYGKYYFNNGDIYEGYYDVLWMDGHGIYKTKDGKTYEGEFMKGEFVKGKVTNPDGSTAQIDRTAEILKEQEKALFIEQAKKGPSYDELLKNSTKYIDTPNYFEGSVIQAIEDKNGKTLLLIDTKSFANSFVDFYNLYSDDPNLYSNVDSEILAVFSDTPVDIVKDDYVKVYGKVMDKYTYKTVNGYTNTVPAIKLMYFDKE